MSLKNKNPYFRIMDAAVNRASEGLRVAEDIARLHLNDRFLTESIKRLRHSLSQVASRILPQNAVLARDTLGDVGCLVETDSEYRRGDVDFVNEATAKEVGGVPVGPCGGLLAMVRANMKRAQQALRTLEECSKVSEFSDIEFFSNEVRGDAGSIAKEFESLRYTSYTIEKAICAVLTSSDSIAEPSIYVLIDGVDVGELFSVDLDIRDFPIDDDRWNAFERSAFASAIKTLIEAKVDFIQLRDKELSDRQLIAAATMIRRWIEGTSTRLIINDRADIAMAVQAHGVHVGQEELKVADVRRIVGPGMLVGVSTHSVEQAKQAVLDGASYIGVGPVFPSSTKSFEDHVGVELVRNVVEAVTIPAFAIGGIDLSNAKQIADVGCRRIAVSGVLRQLFDDPSKMLHACGQLRACLE